MLLLLTFHVLNQLLKYVVLEKAEIALFFRDVNTLIWCTSCTKFCGQPV